MNKKELAWHRLMTYIEEHPFSVMKIEFKDAMPCLAEEVKESIKFT